MNLSIINQELRAEIKELQDLIKVKDHRIKTLESLIEEAAHKGLGIPKVSVISHCKCGGNCGC